jgi:hypothetical protein
MAEIREVDLAWEVLNAFRDLSSQALAAIVQMGGKDPSELRSTDTAATHRLELRARCHDSIASVLAKATPNFSLTPGPSLASLIQAYKQTEATGI